MVSDQNPPLPLPMNVPPGHLVQQIVDENGALRHVILSPQNPHPPMPAGHPYPCLGAASSRHVVSGPAAGGGMQYIPFGANGTGSTVRLPAGPNCIATVQQNEVRKIECIIAWTDDAIIII
ncbi:hypothetical protein D917_09806, partial [Trichinella nativa]